MNLLDVGDPCSKGQQLNLAFTPPAELTSGWSVASHPPPEAGIDNTLEDPEENYTTRPNRGEKGDNMSANQEYFSNGLEGNHVPRTCFYGGTLEDITGLEDKSDSEEA